MPSTAAQNMINVAVIAEEQMEIDKANGTFEANNRIDKYYGWQSDFTLRPAGMDGNPELFAARLRDAFPMANNLRMAFNENCFDASGNLNPQYARFLVAAASEGFAFTFVYTGGDAQAYTAPGLTGQAAANAIHATLSGPVLDGMVEGWTRMLDWLDDHPAVADAVYGHEIVNEPATYRRGEEAFTGDAPHRFKELYGVHMEALAELLMDRAPDAKILVEGWGYSGTFDELALGNVGGRSVLDHIRSVVGDKLVWSAHLYPGWAGIGGELTAEETRGKLEELYRVLGNDSILITETNASGSGSDNPADADGAVYRFVRSAYEWFAERGIGVGWFPAVEFGGSNFVVIDAGGGLRYLHQSALAHGMNAFSLDETNAALAGNDRITTSLVEGRVRNQSWESVGQTFDSTDGMAFGFGYNGNDTVMGLDNANDLIYGGLGNDSLFGLANDDHLFGQGGADKLYAGLGVDHLFGGDGNDTLDGGGGSGPDGDHLTGGRGGDRFMVGAGRTVISDFAASQGDVVWLDGVARTAVQLAALGVRSNVQGTAVANDLTISRPSGDVVLLDFFRLNARDLFGAAAVEVNGGAGNDSITSRFTDAQGNLVGQGSDTVRGEGGNDTVDAAGGDDHVLGHAGNDSLLGGAGHDRLFGGLGNDTLRGGLGNDSLVGDEGGDALYGEDGSDVLTSATLSSQLYGGTGNDRLGAGMDRGADHALWGGAGADTFALTGALARKGSTVVLGDFEAGVDSLILDGQTAAAWYSANRAGVYLVQDGADVRVYLGATQSLVLREVSMVEALSLFGAPANVGFVRGPEDELSTGFGHDHDARTGGAGNDLFRAGGGDDSVSGGDGNDTLYGGSGSDTLSAGRGNDVLYGGSGKDVLYGSSGSNQLYGGSGDDTVASGTQGSALWGGDGNDTIKTLAFKSSTHNVSGGAGADLFVFEGLRAGDGNSRTTVTDFQPGVDRFLRAGVAEDSALDAAVVSQSGAHTLVTFDTGDSVLLLNTDAAAFDAAYG
jgi:Ca2+-binding RTX toxin-like protein